MPTPLAHWPLNVEHQHNDISGKGLHLQEQDGSVHIIKDELSFVREYAWFDGTAFLRARVDQQLALGGNFSIFVAMNPEKQGPIFEYHDKTVPNYLPKLTFYMHDSTYKVYFAVSETSL